MSDGLVIVMRAIPGSGKSTFAKKILKDFEKGGKSVLICSADQFFYDLGGGEYKFDFKLLPQAHGKCFRQFIEAMQARTHDVIIIDNTNLRSSEISPYKIGADAYGYDFIIKEVKADQETAFKRNQHGVALRGHQMMADTMRNESLPPWWKKETYKSSPTSTQEDPSFDLEEPISPEEEATQAGKYSSYQSLNKRIKSETRRLKFEKIIKN